MTCVARACRRSSLRIGLLVAGIAVLAACGGHASSGGADAGAAPTGPPDPPSDVRAEVGAFWNRCNLLWTPPPQPVDGYEITTTVPNWAFDDGDTHGGIAPGRSTMAVLDFSYTTARELTEVKIRIRSRNGTVFSEFSPAVTCVLPVQTPDAAAAAITSSGVVVHWINFSSIATTIDIEKTELDATGAPGTWSPWVTLPAKIEVDNTQLDPAVATGRAYGYRVRAVASGGQRSASADATTLTLGPPLTSTTIQLPPAHVAVSDGRGHYAFASNTAGGLQFTWGTGAPWTSSPAIQATWYGPIVKLDAAGLPHAVYGKPPASGTGVVITHGWSDGTQWLEEQIAQRLPQGFTGVPAVVFDLDPSGAPVLIWRLTGGKFEAATRTGGAWVVTSFDGLLPRDFNAFTAFADATGGTHVVFQGSAITHIELRDGAWTKETVSAPGAIPAGLLLGAGHDTDHLVVCFDAFASLVLLNQPACVRKRASGWGGIEPLGVLPRVSSDQRLAQIAVSSDGDRVAVFYEGLASQLFRSDRNGAWTEVAFAPAGLPGQFIGFDGSGKLFQLTNITGLPATPPPAVDYHLSVEP